MTKNIYNRQTSQSRPRAVRFTPEIIEYLCVPTKQGASRLLAYLLLVQSAVESTTPYTPLYGRTFDMEAGQLVLSITDMAKRWNWRVRQSASSSTALESSDCCQWKNLTDALL